MADKLKYQHPGAKAPSHSNLRFALAAELEPELARDDAERECVAEVGAWAVTNLKFMRAKYASMAVSAMTIGLQEDD